MKLYGHPEQLEHTILSKLRKIAHGDVTALSKETSRSCVITNRYVTSGALHDCTLNTWLLSLCFLKAHWFFMSIQRAPLCAGLTWEQISVEQDWTLSSLSLSHTTRIDRNGKKKTDMTAADKAYKTIVANVSLDLFSLSTRETQWCPLGIIQKNSCGWPRTRQSGSIQ